MIIACVNGSRRSDRFNMDDLELWWGVPIFIIILYLIFSKKQVRKICIIFLILLIPSIRGPFVGLTMMILNILTNGSLKFLTEYSIKFIFCTNIKPKFIGYNFPTKPSIIMANYPTNYIEYMVNHLFDKKICMVVLGAAKLQNFAVSLFYPKDKILFVSKSGCYQQTLELIKEKLDKGYYIFTYIEKDYYKRPKKYSISTIRSGMFRIAKELNTMITPVVCDHIDHFQGLFCNETYRIYIDKSRYIENIDDEIQSVTSLFSRKLKTFKIK